MFKMSFKKANNSNSSSSSRLSGVKPWINGQYNVSMGHNELDTILGGGHTLGTLLIRSLFLFVDLISFHLIDD